MPPLLAVAPSVVMYPKDVVDAMREANGLAQEQMPLRDAAGERIVNVGTDRQHANKAAEKRIAATVTVKEKDWPTGALPRQPISGTR